MEKLGRAVRNRLYYQIQFLSRNEKLRKFFEEVHNLRKKYKKIPIDKIKKDKNIMAQIRPVMNKFSKELEEFYPLNLSELFLILCGYSQGEFLYPPHFVPSITVLFRGKKDRSKIDFEYSDFWVEEFPEILNSVIERKGILRKQRVKGLTIDAVDQKERSITIKVRLDCKEEEIISDLKCLLRILMKESKIFNMDLSKGSKPHWEEIEKFLKVYDLKKANPKLTWSDIAKRIFPKHVTQDKDGKVSISGEFKDRVRHYHERALEMINKGGWRKI